jgi:hypothetical protein
MPHYSLDRQLSRTWLNRYCYFQASVVCSSSPSPSGWLQVNSSTPPPLYWSPFGDITLPRLFPSFDCDLNLAMADGGAACFWLCSTPFLRCEGCAARALFLTLEAMGVLCLGDGRRQSRISSLVARYASSRRSSSIRDDLGPR